jgi:Glycosyl hydrolase family 79 C-terminal beta domain
VLNAAILRTPLPPHIQPQYYAAIIAAEAIGNSNDTQVIELNITDTGISGYAFYENGELTKVILINSLAFFTTTTTARQSMHVDLTFGSGSVPSKMDVKRLSVAYVQFLFQIFDFADLLLLEKLGTRMILRV